MESEGGTCMVALVEGINREVSLVLVRSGGVKHWRTIPESRKQTLLDDLSFILRVIQHSF